MNINFGMCLFIYKFYICVIVLIYNVYDKYILKLKVKGWDKSKYERIGCK